MLLHVRLSPARAVLNYEEAKGLGEAVDTAQSGPGSRTKLVRLNTEVPPSSRTAAALMPPLHRHYAHCSTWCQRTITPRRTTTWCLRSCRLRKKTVDNEPFLYFNGMDLGAGAVRVEEVKAVVSARSMGGSLSPRTNTRCVADVRIDSAQNYKAQMYWRNRATVQSHQQVRRPCRAPSAARDAGGVSRNG